MKVFITGIGAVTTVGNDLEKTWTALLQGKSNIHSIPESWSEFMPFRSRHYSPLPEPNYRDFGFLKNDLVQKDPVSLIAIMATQMALDYAKVEMQLAGKKQNVFNLPQFDSKRVAVVYANGQGGTQSLTANHCFHLLNNVKNNIAELTDNNETLNELNKINLNKRYNSFVVPSMICNAPPANIAMRYQIHGPVSAIVQACASGTTAIGKAARVIANGEVDMAITGGAEHLSDDHGAGMYSFDAARTLAVCDGNKTPSTINRPYDKDRNGFLFSQGGSASLILESERSVKARGIEPIAEILGFGETFDAHSIMAPEPTGTQIERMIRMTLNAADLQPTDIDYINGHGSSTQANDQTETEVISRIFTNQTAMNSTKSILGHTIGASGALEAIVSALSIRDQELHPSLNIDNPIADLDFVTERRKQKVDYVLSHSFAFGGHNSGIILGKV